MKLFFIDKIWLQFEHLLIPIFDSFPCFYQESPSVDYSPSSLQIKRTTLRERSGLREISELKERSRSRSRSRVLRTSHGKCFLIYPFQNKAMCIILQRSWKFYNDLENPFPLVGGGGGSRQIGKQGLGVCCGKVDLWILQIVYHAFTTYIRPWQGGGYPVWSTWQFFKDNTVIIRSERSECICSLLETKKN